MFSGCVVLFGSKNTEFGSTDQEASPSASKNTGVVLVPCSRMEVRPVVWIFLRSLGVICYNICSNFVDCESFLESNSPGILALYETNLDDSIESGNFSVRGYLPLIRKDSSTHMHCLAVYVKEGLPFARYLTLENAADSYLFFYWLYFTQCLTSFSSIDHLLRLCARFLILFHLA